MKTTLEIAREVIGRYKRDAGTANGLAEIMQVATETNQKIVNRLREDQALRLLIRHHAIGGGIAMAGRDAKSIEEILVVGLMSAILDWEEINERFNSQLTTGHQ